MHELIDKIDTVCHNRRIELKDFMFTKQSIATLLLSVGTFTALALPALSGPNSFRSKLTPICKPSGIDTSIDYCYQPTVADWQKKYSYPQIITVENVDNYTGLFYVVDGKEYHLFPGESRVHEIIRRPNGEYTLAIPVAHGDTVFGYDGSLDLAGEDPITIKFWSIADHNLGIRYFRYRVDR